MGEGGSRTRRYLNIGIKTTRPSFTLRGMTAVQTEREGLSQTECSHSISVMLSPQQSVCVHAEVSAATSTRQHSQVDDSNEVIKKNLKRFLNLFYEQVSKNYAAPRAGQ